VDWQAFDSCKHELDGAFYVRDMIVCRLCVFDLMTAKDGVSVIPH
jgi:hypothetical protein